MINLIKRIFNRQTDEKKDEKKLRAKFQARYHHFRLLLDNDRKAHKCMTDMEEALRGETAFSMRFVHRTLANLTTSTFQMIKHLTSLAPNKYDQLGDRFKAIQTSIAELITKRQPSNSGSLTMDIQRINGNHIALAGAKMAALGEVAQTLGLKISPGFVITAEAYHLFMSHNSLPQEISRRIQAIDLADEVTVFQLASSLQQLIIGAEIPKPLAHEILMRFDSMKSQAPSRYAAVRSSALGEDNPEVSFAGQYKSLLNVSRDELLLAYKSVVASKYGLKAMTYRLSRGLREEDIAMCVGVAAMVDATVGGVAYSSGAVDSLDSNISIHSAWGLPKTVVSGTSNVDLFTVKRGKTLVLISKTIADKQYMYTCHPDEGTICLKSRAKNRTAPSLTDQQALGIAKISLQLEEHFNCPQDIEWAIDPTGDFVLLQTRTLVRSYCQKSPPLQIDEQSSPNTLTSGGFTASPGAAYGTIHVARSQADLLLFPDQGVLVVKQALPSWVPLLNKAASVIAEMGSAAGHLASVARELGVPAIFGLKDAGSILKTGQMVTVDADQRTVFTGQLESILKNRPQPILPMKGSPVHTTLAGVARHVLPLHLLDSDAPEFLAKNCRSLHDIIRFCHEKAVREMFSFGRNTPFPQGRAKRLHSGGVKQFWVLNLDDGFDELVEGDTVEIERITSIPMLALWQGMNAVPWQGPPPLNVRGFMSVMYEATVNPALEPAVASPYSLKNYFMVSNNFVSLQSRFGFHFCEVEALVGIRNSENYATFQFQGGAADEFRRIMRAQLVADLLEEHDFLVKVRRDTLSARVEGFDQNLMEARLRIIGHLIIHTRQLDMIMADQAEAERRKSQLRNELTALIS